MATRLIPGASTGERNTDNRPSCRTSILEISDEEDYQQEYEIKKMKP